MSEIPKLCDKIMSQLTKLGLHTAENMLPGLTEDRIRQLTSSLPFQLPRTAIELYQWSEGLGPEAGEGTDFFPGYGMEPLSEMIATYNELSTADDYPRFRSGQLQWFPLFQSGGTDYYAICCTESATADGQIVDDDNEGPHRNGVTLPDVKFLGLESMLRTLLECFETGVYFVNDAGQLDVGTCTYDKKGRLVDVDLSACKEVARKYNPGL
jgi:hypothetical protein